MWNSLELNETLRRKLWDDVFKCIHCGSKKIVYNNTKYDSFLNPAINNLLGIQTKFAHCSSCHKRLEYLEDRHYGLNYQKISRNHERHDPWKKDRTPLWAIGNK